MAPRLAAALAALSLAGCAPSGPARDRVPSPRPEAKAPAPPAPPATSPAPEGPAPTADLAPAEVFDPSLPAEVPVPGDLVALVAHGATGDRRAIVYLHGVCGDVTKYRSWAEAAVHFGTLVALRGDDRCKEPGRFKWGASVERTDRRIVAAVRAVGGARAAPLDTEPITLVGYSQGSARAEALARAFPSRYRRAVLVAGPREHAPESFREALGIAFVAGENDLKAHLRDSAAKAAKAGVRARYFELPGARHGEYGPGAAKVMGDALGWVLAAGDAG